MTCAKVRVTCTLTLRDGSGITGENSCAKPQLTCPRLPGEGYDKCKTVCEQGGHAELQVLAFARQVGADTTGATATMRGHTYFCMDCQHALFGAGVKFLTVEKP